MPAGDGMRKGRPVVIVRNEGDTVICYICTSQPSGTRRRYRVEDIVYAGLDHDSYIDLEPRRVPKKKIGRVLGHLDDYDLENIGL